MSDDNPDVKLEVAESRTPRGFQLVEFQDLYGKECSVQASSIAIYTTPGTSALWIGKGEERMHLSRRQVKQLAAYLKRWAKTGRLFEDDVSRAREAEAARMPAETGQEGQS